jgi:hypothetical protein
MKRFLAKLEIAILQPCSGQAREKRPWFAMTIEQKNVFDSAVCKNGKLLTGHEIVSFLRFEQRFSVMVSFTMTPNMNIYEMD